ncbi:MAG: porin family protein [Flavobacteriaceae bacterium]|nr:porin family protein [Flavobacteriaceae bacterium]
MKFKILFLTAILFTFSTIQSEAQERKFGVTAGFLNVSGTIEVENNEFESADKSGGFLGIVAQFGISEKFTFQPELLYARNEDYGLLMLPLIFKYYPVDKFNIQLGPQFDYSTDPYPIEDNLGFAQDIGVDIDEDDFTRLGISLAAGLGYDISEKWFLESRYTFQLNNVYTGDLNISIKGHILNVGLGYRF